MKSLKIKKICVISGSRADYGILKNIIKKIKISKKYKLQLIATGSHLSKKHGNTISEILSDGFQPNVKIKILVNKSNAFDLIKNSSKVLNGYAKAFNNLNPDLVLILGDRYEIFCAAYAATIFGVPIAHLHGGEVTQNSYDEFFRHAISKLSQLHFVSTNQYKKRVIQLGESPKNVFNTGAVGLEDIKKYNFFKSNVLEKKLKLKFMKKSLLITLHPETLNRKEIEKNTEIVLSALKKLKDTTLIFTMPNSDIKSYDIEKKIRKFCKINENAFFFRSLGRKLYLSCVKKTNAVLGNSSSGIIEVPSLNKPTIDLGKRQHGRIRATSVITCDFNKMKILRAIKKVYSKNFLLKIKNLKNPYYKKDSSKKVLKIIDRIKISDILPKKFYDINF